MGTDDSDLELGFADRRAAIGTEIAGSHDAVSYDGVSENGEWDSEVWFEKDCK